MKTIKIILSGFLLVHALAAFSQESILNKANKNYEMLAYADAIDLYKNIVDHGKGNLEVYQKLGNSYYFNSDLENASKWYQKMIDTQEEIAIIYYFRASQSFKHTGDYDKAHELLKIAETLGSEVNRKKRYIENPDYLDAIAKQSGRYKVANLSENSSYTDFAPSFYKEQVVFASARKKRKFTDQKNHWTDQPYLELLASDIDDTGGISRPFNFSGKLNTRVHESTTAFTDDGKTVYFTRNNFINSKLKKDTIQVSRLKIYRAKINNKGKWSTVVELPFNDSEYSVAHPTLNANETKLYFASDMPGGYGMSDIYSVDIHKDGSFGSPKNLGAKINTEGRDTFPFLSKEEQLYFASDGHLGLGGLDIFVVDLKDSKKNIYNVGRPINSPSDDITLIIDDRTKKGYFASNRKGGKGDDDIYSLIELKPIVAVCEGSVQGIVKDEESGVLLTNADVEVKEENGNVLYYGKTDDKGVFKLDVDCDDRTYEIVVIKEDFDPVTKRIRLTRKNPNPVEEVALKNNAPAIGIDLAELLNLQPIYFASNKAIINNDGTIECDKVVAFMNEYPTINIEIGSHTDSRGSDSYNLKLSTKRATATANYIVSKGIDANRVKSKGYGETVLKNNCDNSTKCNKEEHSKNRRSEFIITKN